MGFECYNSASEDYELPEIEKNIRGRTNRSTADVSSPVRKPVTGGDANIDEGDDYEYTVEAVQAVEWDELKLVCTMKWKNYSSDENTKEKLSYVVSLQEPYKYLTEVNKSHLESKCFMIFTGLHKDGYRWHCADDRFFFCVRKDELINSDYYNPYLRMFDSIEHRNELVREYNTRLERLDEPFVYKVVNEVDLAMPSPFFGVDILGKEKESVDQLPSVIQRTEMSIIRLDATWSLKTESDLSCGTTLFEIKGKKCDPKLAFDHMKNMGELVAFSHFVYVAEEEKTGDEFTIDRRGIFDPLSCIAHSCDPNCKMKWDKRSNKVTVVARRNINKGETLSLDHFPDNKVNKNKDALVKRIDANRDCIECTCSSDKCRVVLWVELLYDPMFYDYLKEDKLKKMKFGYTFKGVRFNTE